MPNVTHAGLLARAEGDTIYVTPGEEAAVRALAWFKSYMDPRIQLSEPYKSRGERPIGLLGSHEVVVRRWLPGPDDENTWVMDTSDRTFAEWTESQRGSDA